MSDLMTIANELVAGCREGRETANLDAIYSPQAVSVEPFAMGEAPRETAGIEGIKGKHAWWEENFEVHSMTVSDPMPHGEDRFAVTFQGDVTMKASGQKMPLNEVAIYTVEGGKITKEEFFFAPGS